MTGWQLMTNHGFLNFFSYLMKDGNVVKLIEEAWFTLVKICRLDLLSMNFRSH